MANKKKHIDQFFRDQLSDFQIPGGDAEFGAILKGIAEKKRKKKLFWWIVGLFIVLASLLGGFLLMKPFADGEVSSQSITQKAQDSNILNENPELFSEHKNQKAVENDVLGFETGENETRPIEKSENAGTEISIPESARKDINSSSHRVINNGPDRIKSENSTPTATVSEPIPDSKFTVASDGEEDSKKATNGIDSIKKPIEDAIETVKIDSSLDEQLPVIRMAQDTIPPVKSKTFKYYVGVSSGLTKASFNAKSPKIGSDNYEKWKENEKGLWSNSFGVDFGFKLKQWIAETGFTSSTLKFENSDFRLQVFDSFPVRNPQGDTIDWVYKNYRDTSFFAPERSTYTSFSIPIRVGYEFDINPKLGLSALAAVQFNKQTQQTGNSINQNTHLRPASALPLRNWTNDIQVGLGCYYHMGENWRIDARTFFSQSGGLYLKTTDLDTRMQSFNFNFTLRYEINP